MQIRLLCDFFVMCLEEDLNAIGGARDGGFTRALMEL
jgi:hypothetical protein